MMSLCILGRKTLMTLRLMTRMTHRMTLIWSTPLSGHRYGSNTRSFPNKLLQGLFFPEKLGLTGLFSASLALLYLHESILYSDSRQTVRLCWLLECQNSSKINIAPNLTAGLLWLSPAARTFLNISVCDVKCLHQIIRNFTTLHRVSQKDGQCIMLPSKHESYQETPDSVQKEPKIQVFRKLLLTWISKCIWRIWDTSLSGLSEKDWD